MFDKNKYLRLFSENNVAKAMIIEEVISEIENLTLPILLNENKERMYKAAERFLWLGEKQAYYELILDIERLYKQQEKEKNLYV